MLHHLRDPPFPQRFKDEMDVVGHEAEGVDADAIAAGEAIKPVEVRDELSAGREDSLPAAASLVDMINFAHFPVALARRGTGQTGFFPGEVGHLLISVFSAGKFSYIFKENRKNIRPTLRQMIMPQGHNPLTN